MNDPLYYSRTNLANKLLASLKDGISDALTLFAPRRMGKTQFLLKDVKPKAEGLGFNVFYYSFMDQGTTDQVETAFIQALANYLSKVSNGTSKLLETLNKIKGINVLGVGISVDNKESINNISISAIISELAEKSPKPILMLLDEIQELARIKGTEGLIKSLRTGLDINRNKIKIIFTGSSTNGLRAMFNDHKAPFFHFAHALDFPHLTQEFTDFLANIYEERTGNYIDKTEFFNIFKRFHYTPLYLRTITQDMIINPDLPLNKAVELRLSEMEENTDNKNIWNKLSELERIILRDIAHNETNLYSNAKKKAFAEQLGVEKLSTSSIQGKIRKLEKMELLTRSSGNTLKINSPYFHTWIMENI